MARISSNRLCGRAVQDKLYQLLVNNKPLVYHQQIRNQSTATGSVYLSNRNKYQQFKGFNAIARDLAASKQVNRNHHQMLPRKKLKKIQKLEKNAEKRNNSPFRHVSFLSRLTFDYAMREREN